MQRESCKRIGAVRDTGTDLFPARQTDPCRKAKFQSRSLEHPHRGHLDLERIGRHFRRLLEQFLRVARIDCEAPELRDVLAVARALQRLLHARISADAAHRGHDIGKAMFLQWTERDLDHDLAAVTLSRDQIHLRTHRSRARSP